MTLKLTFQTIFQVVILLFQVLFQLSAYILVLQSRVCNIDKNNRAGRELNNITTSAGYNLLIDGPTHFFDEISSWIDLIFSSDLILLPIVEMKVNSLKM